MKLAIMGGSFNPVHIGHLFLADSVVSGLGYDRVILVPAYQSPFKAGAEGASAADRMDMLAASIAGDPRLTVDNCEIRREGVSYTIDTLKDIIARYDPDGKPGLILGDDLAADFLKWRSHAEIASLADIIIARRSPGLEKSATPEEYTCNKDSKTPETNNFPYPYKTLNNEIIEVSSSLLREKIRTGKAWRYLIPSGAGYIIEDRKLYGYSGEVVSEDSKNRTGLTPLIIRIENDVRSVFGFERFIHSRNTAILSRDLSRRLGMDPQKAYLAGIAHDICKQKSHEDLIRLAASDGKSITKLEKKKPGLLHARAAAVYVKKKYGISDRDILDAIRYHTTGSRDMCPLAKIVYIADKLEISRLNVDPVLRKMSQNADLDTLFAAVLDNTVAFLKSRDLDISYGTRRLLFAMQKRNKL